MAQFSVGVNSAQLLTGRCGSAEVGYIDPTALTGEDPQRLLLLAGRSWLVKEIEWAKKVVWLEPAKEGGKARWMGGARSLSREVCQGIRAALVGSEPTVAYLSQRGRLELASLREELALSPDAHFMSRTEGSLTRTWTFAGTKQNRTYARSASIGGARVKFDALSVQAPAALMHRGDSDSDIALTDEELGAFAEGIKFAACVPTHLLRRTVSGRFFVQLQSPA